MADVKDILNISTEKTPSKVESILVGKKRTPAATLKRKKPEGVSREVFALQESALLGAGLPPAAPPPQAPIFKEKRTAESHKVSWVWRGFRNSARQDNAVFKHWVKSDDKAEDYKFARYNRKLKLQSYTNDEYTKYFQDTNWTREETDQLFDLCRRFDLRFIIVHDQFEPSTPSPTPSTFPTTTTTTTTTTSTTASTSTPSSAPSPKPKTVEDLKERFYSISSKLLELHKLPDEDLHANPLHHYTFNKKQEEERKQQSDRLFLRSAAQVLEEESLVEQFRRLEGEMKKHNKAKKRIAHLMQYALTPNPTAVAPPTTPTTPTFSTSDYTTPPPPQQLKTKKRKNHPDDDDELYEPEAVDYEPTVTVRKRDRSVDKSANRFQTTPLTMESKVTKGKVTKAINELKQDLVILLDLQKYVPQKEYHLEVIKAHRDGLLKEMQARNIPIPQFTNHVTDKNVCWRRERKRGRRGEEEERRFEGAISKSSNMRATNATFKKALASSSTSSVFGLASLGDGEENSDLLSLEAELFAPPPPPAPPARVRTRDKEGKRTYKRHRAVVDA